MQKGVEWKELLLFILGKIIAFSGLGLIVWLMGKEIQNTLTLYFPFIFFILILWYLGFSGTLMKKGRKARRFVQNTAGIAMIFLGIIDTITYWFKVRKTNWRLSHDDWDQFLSSAS